MTTATIRIGNVMAAQRRQEYLTQSKSGAIASEQSTKRILIKGHGHEEWTQRIEEAWQRHLETLQQYMGELLFNNQRLSTALLAASKPDRGHADAGNL